MSDVEYEDGDVNVVADSSADDVAAENTDGDGDGDGEDAAAASDNGNAASGALPKAVLEYVAKAIVDDPDSVVVESDEGRRGVELSLHVSPDDMGKVIGKRGRVAQAIRAVVRAAGATEGVETNVDIVD
jgi:predicted RNA-binding protein YlqC (UPF0109 family)